MEYRGETYCNRLLLFYHVCRVRKCAPIAGQVRQKHALEKIKRPLESWQAVFAP